MATGIFGHLLAPSLTPDVKAINRIKNRQEFGNNVGIYAKANIISL